MQLAIALYNNNIEDEDELEFRKGDVLTVLIENPNGLDGWWLCKHKEKCGLCPGNRLQLISNTVSTSNKFTESLHSSSRLSTVSMYDDPSKNYDNTITDHDYDNSRRSDFISDSKPLNSLSESSSRSSGIYSTNELHLSLSSSSSESYSTPIQNNSLSSIDIDQLQICFEKLSIRSLLLDKYRQVISKTNMHSFIIECHLFLDNYGYLLDRYTYKTIKENFLYELNTNQKRIMEISTKIIQLIKPIIELRLKQKSNKISLISNDVFRKLHLEPIFEEISNEKMSTSLSTTDIYGKFFNKNNRSHMSNSKTFHSMPSQPYKKSNDYDYIDDDYSLNPLIRCYYRHINEQVNLILKRYSNFGQNENKISVVIIEGKALIVAGHKLIFVLETLHEHLQQIQTSLILLTTQLCEALTTLIQLLKQLSHSNCTNIQKLIIHFKQDTKRIINIVKKIKEQCRLD